MTLGLFQWTFFSHKNVCLKTVVYLNKVLNGQALPQGPTPYRFIITIVDRKGTPFIYLLLANGTPFAY